MESTVHVCSVHFFTAQGHLLRKVVDSVTGRFYLALFLYITDNTQVRSSCNMQCILQKYCGTPVDTIV